MTDTPTGQSTQGKSVRLAVLFVVLALAGLAAAVVYVGGIDAVAELVGLGGRDTVAEIPPKPEVPPVDPEASDDPAVPADETASEEATAPVDPEADVDAPAAPAAGATAPGATQPSRPAGTTPPASATHDTSAAQADMYREQLRSQPQLARLVNNEVSQISISAANVSGDRASVPVNVSYRAGGSRAGSMVFARSNGMWFFHSLTASGRDPSSANPRTVDSGVVNTIASQQAEDSNQDLITRGLVQGGFASARVDGVTQGSGTATVNVTLLGGSLDRQAARFVLISKVEGGNKLWFVTRFELR